MTGASSVLVFVVVEDQRSNQVRVGDLNGIPVVSTTDVAETTKDAVEGELGARGFKIGAGPKSLEVRVQILRFNAGGSAAATVTGELTMHVQVERSGRQIIYSQNFDATYSEVHFYGPSAYSPVLSGALKEGVDKLFADPAFIDALIQKPKNNANAHRGALVA